MIHKLIPIDALKKTLFRFPLSVVCSLSVYLIAVLGLHDFIDLDDLDGLLGRLLILLVYGFFAFGLARLVAEGQGWDKAREFCLGFVVMAVLAFFVFFGSGFSAVWFLALMVPALLLGLTVAPYLSSNDSLSYWFYNRQMWSGALIAILAGIIWGAGISAILASVRYLFGVDIDEKIYGDVWFLASLVLGPLYALSWVPDQYEFTEDDCHSPPQLAFLVNWILAPLVLVYMLILYAYFIKIAIAWELPRGQLSYMVTAFGGVGIATYLMSWPLREQGGALVRLLHKAFFPTLLIPLGMMTLSVFERINQYGVTEQRYVVVLAVVWFAFLVVAYSFRKLPLKYMTGVLGVFLVIAAVGPLSAPNISERSQFERFESLLVKYDALVEGEITKTSTKISWEDRVSLSSIIDYFRSRKKMDRIEVLLPVKQDGSVYTSRQVAELIGFDFVGKYNRKRNRYQPKRISLQSPEKKLLEVDGYRYVITNLQQWQCRKKEEVSLLKSESSGVNVTCRDYVLTVQVEGYQSLSLDVEEYAFFEQEKGGAEKERLMIVDQNSGDLRVRYIFNSLNLMEKYEEGNGAEPALSLTGFTVNVLVDF